MDYTGGLEYVINGYNIGSSCPAVSYFSKNTDDNYGFKQEDSMMFVPHYTLHRSKYKNQKNYPVAYPSEHLFTPERFLNPQRPKARFVHANDKVRDIAEETFELMTKEKLPCNISINILPFDEFKVLHSIFEIWSNGILGFSLNGTEKKVFVMENNLDSLMLVIGHEIGHVWTEALPNKHDEEAKAFAFSIEWSRTIKKNNVANLGLSIKENIDFQPARNGLHDVASSFVDFIVRKGKKPIDLHNDLVKRYISVFDRVY